MKSGEAFNDAYAKLNAEQKVAVDSIEGPVFVIAGPGTGKTQILALRIANILRMTDTPSDAILALTFTDAAVHEMRARLIALIGAPAYRIRIHTFHGFAESLIARFPDQFPGIIGSHVATDAERAEMIDAAIMHTRVTHLRPYGDPLYYHYAVGRAIQTLKRENVPPKKLAERLAGIEQSFEAREDIRHEKGKFAGKLKGVFEGEKKRIEKTKDLLLVYQAYQEQLTLQKRYDFEDLILEVVSALERDEHFRLQVAESLIYILADEHQDANRAQNALLEHVASFFDNPNLFIVGDEKQAIYRFQGADLDNVHYFRSRFSGTKIITLVDNYRSTRPILESARSLITASRDERLSRVELVPRAGHAEVPISISSYPSYAAEMKALAEHIAERIRAGTDPASIAVLVRRNKDVARVTQSLTGHGINISGGGEANAFTNRFVRSLLRTLAFIKEPGNEGFSGVAALPGLSISAGDTLRIAQAARLKKVPILSLLQDTKLLDEIGLHNPSAATALGITLEGLITYASYERPAVIAEAVVRASGLLQAMLTASDRADSLAAIRALFNALEDMSRRDHTSTLSSALERLHLMQERGVPLPSMASANDTRVRVLTVHKSKGREFSFVYLPQLTEHAWSTRTRSEHFELPDILSGSAELEDERRLLYVAITRARQEVTVSYAHATEDRRDDGPSALLEDLDPAYLKETIIVEDVEDALLTKHRVPEHGKPSSDDTETLNAALFAQGISATALNNYIECPWKYFYVNLMRIPESENKFMTYGTCIHVALRAFADGKNRGEDIGIEGLLSRFTYQLERSALTEQDIEELRSKGERALATWWNERHGAWPEDAKAELSLEAQLALEGGEHITLRGAIDLLVRTDGGALVVDYKTGKHKSRNEILGLTKAASGDFYRQLTFYKLLLRLADPARGLPQHMHTGRIEFVEPNERDQLRIEDFEIPEEHVEDLISRIRTTIEEIRTLSFWNTRCEGDECPWCELRAVPR